MSVDPILILGSRSPRRAKLLREAGYAFSQVTPVHGDPEQPAAGGDPAQVAIDLAEHKARGVALALTGEPARYRRCVIIGADTICVDAAGGLIGTPTTAEAALAILRRFSGVTHAVVTGVALLRPGDGKLVTFADRVEVTVGTLSAEQMQEHVGSGAWRGKAGGYNLEEARGKGWPITLPEGADAATVVGLPMRKLQVALADLGVKAASRVQGGRS